MDVERTMDTTLSIHRIAHALACPIRLHVLQMLGEDGLSVTDIATKTGISTSTTCHHLNELVRVGLAVRKRKGRASIYRWSDSRVYIRVERVEPSASTST